VIAPRWKKVLRDLWTSKSRTMLVVVSIFIGVFAVGVISGTRTIVVEELERSYQKIHPAHKTIMLSGENSFDDSLLQAVRRIDGVEEAEGRRSASVSLETEPDTWEDMQLTSIADFEDIVLNQLRFLEGSDDPRDKEVLIERSSMKELNVAVGDKIVVEMADGDQKSLKVAGVVHDLAVHPTKMSGRFYGYVTPGTLEWLGEGYDFTQMLIRVAPDAPVGTYSNGGSAQGGMRGGGGDQSAASSNTPSNSQILYVLDEVQAKIEKSGRDIHISRGPHGRISNEHWAASFISELSMMMNVLGVMSLFLSGFLVTNTIAALLAQQIRQIGILKAIGARSRQIVLMYMVQVVCFGMLSILLALPLTLLVTNVFVSYIADYFNPNALFPMVTISYLI